MRKYAICLKSHICVTHLIKMLKCLCAITMRIFLLVLTFFSLVSSSRLVFSFSIHCLCLVFIFIVFVFWFWFGFLVFFSTLSITLLVYLVWGFFVDRPTRPHCFSPLAGCPLLWLTLTFVMFHEKLLHVYQPGLM